MREPVELVGVGNEMIKPINGENGSYTFLCHLPNTSLLTIIRIIRFKIDNEVLGR